MLPSADWLDGYAAGLSERLGGVDHQSRVMRSLVTQVCEGQLVSVAVVGMTHGGAAWMCWDPGDNWIHLVGGVEVLRRAIEDGSK